jgi:hypothetical protein
MSAATHPISLSLSLFHIHRAFWGLMVQDAQSDSQPALSLTPSRATFCLPGRWPLISSVRRSLTVVGGSRCARPKKHCEAERSSAIEGIELVKKAAGKQRDCSGQASRRKFKKPEHRTRSGKENEIRHSTASRAA